MGGNIWGAVGEMVVEGGFWAVLEFLGDVRVWCRSPSGRARVDEGRLDEEMDEEEVPRSKGEEGRQGPP